MDSQESGMPSPSASPLIGFPESSVVYPKNPRREEKDWFELIPFPIDCPTVENPEKPVVETQFPDKPITLPPI